MIGRIKGTVLEKKAQEVLVDVNGVGYEVLVPMTTVFQLPGPGREVVLYTHLVVREDAHALYGFVNERERGLFRVLIRVSGIGPRMALAILSGIEANEFVDCVHNNDVNALVRLPGIGRKTAERVIMEVRDRLRDWEGEGGISAPAVAGKDPGLATCIQEAETALVSLGYKPQEAGRAVAGAARQLEGGETPIDSGALIKLALKNMG